MEEEEGFPKSWFLNPPDRLVCGLCLGILNNPKQCKNGHYFCYACIRKSICVLTVKNKCPVCKILTTEKNICAGLLAKELVDELQVRCVKNLGNSCVWSGGFQQRTSHTCIIRRSNQINDINISIPLSGSPGNGDLISSDEQFIQSSNTPIPIRIASKRHSNMDSENSSHKRLRLDNEEKHPISVLTNQHQQFDLLTNSGDFNSNAVLVDFTPITSSSATVSTNQLTTSPSTVLEFDTGRSIAHNVSHCLNDGRGVETFRADAEIVQSRQQPQLSAHVFVVDLTSNGDEISTEASTGLTSQPTPHQVTPLVAAMNPVTLLRAGNLGSFPTTSTAPTVTSQPIGRYQKMQLLESELNSGAPHVLSARPDSPLLPPGALLEELIRLTETSDSDEECEWDEPLPFSSNSKNATTELSTITPTGDGLTHVTLQNASHSYSGSVNSLNQKHGHGTMTFDSGRTVYCGDFQCDKKSGQGEQTSKRAGQMEKYTGAWKENKRHGHGVEFKTNGDVYSGEWRNNSHHGQGCLQRSDGSSYEGGWYSGNRHGNGVSVSSSGEEVKETWRDGVKQRYQPNFRSCKEKSRGGVYSRPTEQEPEPVSAIEPHSLAVRRDLLTPSDSNVASSINVVTSPSHHISIPPATIPLIDAPSDCYVGPLKDGLRRGKGTMTYTNGDVYSGEWRNDMRHGIGTLTCVDGRLGFSGTWRKDEKYEGNDIFADGRVKFFWDNKVAIIRRELTVDAQRAKRGRRAGQKTSRVVHATRYTQDEDEEWEELLADHESSGPATTVDDEEDEQNNPFDYDDDNGGGDDWDVSASDDTTVETHPSSLLIVSRIEVNVEDSHDEDRDAQVGNELHFEQAPPTSFVTADAVILAVCGYPTVDEHKDPTTASAGTAATDDADPSSDDKTVAIPSVHRVSTVTQNREPIAATIAASDSEQEAHNEGAAIPSIRLNLPVVVDLTGNDAPEPQAEEEIEVSFKRKRRTATELPSAEPQETQSRRSGVIDLIEIVPENDFACDACGPAQHEIAQGNEEASLTLRLESVGRNAVDLVAAEVVCQNDPITSESINHERSESTVSELTEDSAMRAIVTECFSGGEFESAAVSRHDNEMDPSLLLDVPHSQDIVLHEHPNYDSSLPEASLVATQDVEPLNNQLIESHFITNLPSEFGVVEAPVEQSKETSFVMEDVSPESMEDLCECEENDHGTKLHHKHEIVVDSSDDASIAKPVSKPVIVQQTWVIPERPVIKPIRKSKSKSKNASYHGKRNKAGQKHGQGEFTTNGGKCTYIGQFVRDKRNGHGTQSLPNGDVYSGNWVNDCKHGVGVMWERGGDVYSGEWRSVDGWDYWWGQGRAVYADGSSYEGGWEEGKRHGEGVAVSSSGVVSSGVWCQGDLVKRHTSEVILTTKYERGISTLQPLCVECDAAGHYFCDCESEATSEIAPVSPTVASRDEELSEVSVPAIIGDADNETPIDCLLPGVTTHTISIASQSNDQVSQFDQSTSNCGDSDSRCVFESSERTGFTQDIVAANSEFIHSLSKLFNTQFQLVRDVCAVEVLSSAPLSTLFDKFNDSVAALWSTSVPQYTTIINGTIVECDASLHNCIYSGDANRLGHKNGSGTFSFPCEEREEEGSRQRGVYEGEFQNDKRHGYGEQQILFLLTSSNDEDDESSEGEVASSYQGEWRADKRHGYGVQLCLETGDVYRGMWARDRREGEGRLDCADGTAYEGQWVGNERSGYGIEVNRKGKVYTGEWMRDLRHGNGSTVYLSGDVVEAVWCEGVRVGGKHRTKHD